MMDKLQEEQMEEARFWAVIEGWVGKPDYDWTEAANAVEDAKGAVDHVIQDRDKMYRELTEKITRIQQLNAHLIVMAAAARTLLSVIDQDDPGDEWGRAIDNMRTALIDVSTGAVGTPCEYAPRCVDERWQGHEDHVARRR